MASKISRNNLYKIFAQDLDAVLYWLRADKKNGKIFKVAGRAVGVNSASFGATSFKVFVAVGLPGSDKSTPVRVIAKRRPLLQAAIN